MAGIGDDIKEVLAELGTEITIHLSNGTTIIGEYIDSEGYPDHSTLFTRMFMRHGTVAFDTQINIGSIIEYGGEYLIVTNKTRSEFENNLIEYELVTYRSNVIGTFQRYDDTPEYDANYDRVSEWSNIAENVRGCQVEKKLAEELADHAHILAVAEINNILYVSADHDIKQADRWVLSSGEKYKIESVANLEMPGISIVRLGDDDRG